MVIDKMIQQVVLQRNGEDPDPSLALANFDLRQVFRNLNDSSHFKEGSIPPSVKLQNPKKEVTKGNYFIKLFFNNVNC